MDQDRRISAHDMLRFLRQTGFNETHESECQQLISYFDNGNSGTLSYDDFLQIILPCDAPQLRQLVIKKQNLGRTGDWIDIAVENELALLLYKEIVFSRQLE